MMDLNRSNIHEITSRHGIVLVNCWAVWCRASQRFNPVFQQLEKVCPDHTFACLDTDHDIELATEMNIGHIPALIIYRDGILLFHQSGYFRPDQVRDIIEQVEALDMDSIQAELVGAKRTGSD